MRRAVLIAALTGGFFVSCTFSGIQLAPHPTLDHPVAACHITCPEGWLSLQQRTCRNDKQWTEDIRITGEDDVPESPAESRWLTGATSIIADAEVVRRLAKRNITPHDPEWPHEYVALLHLIQKDLGGDAFSSYLKSEVVLGACESYRVARCMSKITNPCAAMPGEPDPLGRSHP